MIETLENTILSKEEIKDCWEALKKRANNFYIETYGEYKLIPTKRSEISGNWINRRVKKDISLVEKLRLYMRQDQLIDKFEYDLVIDYFKKQGFWKDGKTTLRERQKQVSFLKKKGFDINEEIPEDLLIEKLTKKPLEKYSIEKIKEFSKCFDLPTEDPNIKELLIGYLAKIEPKMSLEHYTRNYLKKILDVHKIPYKDRMKKANLISLINQRTNLINDSDENYSIVELRKLLDEHKVEYSSFESKEELIKKLNKLRV